MNDQGQYVFTQLRVRLKAQRFRMIFGCDVTRASVYIIILKLIIYICILSSDEKSRESSLSPPYAIGTWLAEM